MVAPQLVAARIELADLRAELEILRRQIEDDGEMLQRIRGTLARCQHEHEAIGVLLGKLSTLLHEIPT